MTPRIRDMLAEPADALVRESFSGVEARWWWERRIEGGIAVCQELDPREVVREISGETGRDEEEVRGLVAEELGTGDEEPVVLTFEVPGDATADEAARLLAERSSGPRGLATGLYRRVESAAREAQ